MEGPHGCRYLGIKIPTASMASKIGITYLKFWNLYGIPLMNSLKYFGKNSLIGHMINMLKHLIGQSFLTVYGNISIQKIIFYLLFAYTCVYKILPTLKKYISSLIVLFWIYPGILDQSHFPAWCRVLI